MDLLQAQNLAKKKSHLKRIYAKVALALVSRAIVAASSLSHEIKREISTVPDGTVYSLSVAPGIGSGKVIKLNNRFFRASKDASIDVNLTFRNLYRGLEVLTFSKSAYLSYAQNGVAVTGTLPETLAFLRVFDVLETLLLPAFISRKVLKELSPIPIWRRWFSRFAIIILLPFAKKRSK